VILKLATERLTFNTEPEVWLNKLGENSRNVSHHVDEVHVAVTDFLTRTQQHPKAPGQKVNGFDCEEKYYLLHNILTL